MRTPKEVKCSFCGKKQGEVQKMITGPRVHICDDCVRVCGDILDREFGVKRGAFVVTASDAEKSLDVLERMKKEELISEAEYRERACALLTETKQA